MDRHSRETQPGVPYLDHARLDRAIGELGGAQHAVFSLDQLVALGITASAVRRRATAGRLHRIHRAVYGLVPVNLLTRNGRFQAAVLACGPGAVLSHRAAAALLELRRSERAQIDVTVPRRSSCRHAGIELHRSTTLAADEVVHRAGIPCTSVARRRSRRGADAPRPGPHI